MSRTLYGRLGKYLKKARVDAGLTQQEVAMKLGFKTAQYISNWERGMSTPPLQSMREIVSMYNMDSAQLMKELLEIQKKLMLQQYEHKKQKIERLFSRKRVG